MSWLMQRQLFAQERPDEALALVETLCRERPEPRHIRILLAAYKQMARFPAAIHLCRDQLARQPEQLVWTLELARGLLHTGAREEAVALLREAWEKTPSNLKIAQALIQALSAEERYAEALEVAHQITVTSPDRPDAVLTLAALWRDMGEPEQALALLQPAIDRHPLNLVLYQAIVECLRRLERLDEAQAWVAKALATLSPAQVTPWAVKKAIDLANGEVAGPALIRWQENEPNSIQARWAVYEWAREFKRFDMAERALDAIEKRKPGHLPALRARIKLASDFWRTTETIRLARLLCVRRPDEPGHWITLLSELVKTGEFDEFDAIWQRLDTLWGVERYSQYPNFFFNINCHPDWSEARVWEFYRLWHEKAVAPTLPVPRPHPNRRDPERRLKIGYISPDFRRHAVAYFSEPLLIAHDRDQFELYAFAHLKPGERDAYTERFKTYVDHWIEIGVTSDAELEKMIREREIDILIDLAGHTANHRLGVFARRPAPVQASWIFGAGQTTGLPEVDYLLSDAAILPPEFEAFCAEKVIRLPFPGLPMKPAHDALDPVPLPCLAQGFVTFGVLARPLRTNRRTVAVWAEILKRVPDSMLRFDHVPYAEFDIQQRFKAQFAEQGIGEERLIFKNTRPHWRAYQEIDLQLDPFPAGSGTTATEGLFMERLTVTLNGHSPMGRIAGAVLAALGLEEECSATTLEEYVDKAAALASNPIHLAERSAGLRERMQKSWLMDYPAYGREAAKLYRTLWRVWCERESISDLG